jgi:uncharacterized protein with PQ loop repeat
MKKQTSLITILIISIAGLLFSGFLSYGELIKKSCSLAGGCQNIAGIPVCIYGFVMYLIIFIITLLGLKNKKN